MMSHLLLAAERLRGNHPICQNGLLTDLVKSRTTSAAELAQINVIIIDLPIQMPQNRQRHGDWDEDSDWDSLAFEIGAWPKAESTAGHRLGQHFCRGLSLKCCHM